MEVEQIKEMNLSHLQQLAREHGVKGYYTMRKPALVETLTKLFTAEKGKTTASGLLETMNEGFGFLRRQHYYYSDDDIYISASQIRRFNLRNGDLVSGIIRPPKDNERYYALLQVEEINGKIRFCNQEYLRSPSRPSAAVSMETEPEFYRRDH